MKDILNIGRTMNVSEGLSCLLGNQFQDMLELLEGDHVRPISLGTEPDIQILHGNKPRETNIYCISRIMMISDVEHTVVVTFLLTSLHCFANLASVLPSIWPFAAGCCFADLPYTVNWSNTTFKGSADIIE